MEDSMQKHCFSLGAILLLVGMVFSIEGCRGKPEAKSPPPDSGKPVQAAAAPKAESSTVSSGEYSSSPVAPLPPVPANRTPVIVKPKLLEAQAPPAASRNLPDASAPPNSIAMNSRAAPNVEPFEQPAATPDPNNPARDPVSGNFLSVESFNPNPLRADSALAGAGDVASSPIAENSAPATAPAAIPQTRKMSARAMPMIVAESAPAMSADATSPGPGTARPAPMIPPPESPSAGAVPPESNSPTASAGAVPPTPVAAGGDYAVVKVFYGTDRAAVEESSSKSALFQSYLMLAIAAAAFAAILAFAGFRLLRWKIVKAIAGLSLLATAVLGVMAGYAAFGGRPSAGAEKTSILAYGDKRGALELGSCEVSIPKRHEIGELESPSILRLDYCEDPAKHVVLMKVEREAADDFYANLRTSVAQSNGYSAFVFVHGYNVTFEDAARRTAQIAYDLKIGGVPILYSWPSQGKLLDYAVDETNAVWTTPHLRQFLADLARQSGAKQIHLIAHSMGNRALTGALRDLAMQADPTLPPFNQVLLTAPDIDADVFKNDIVPAITKMAKRVTLYASSKDEALLLSKKLHGYPRAGEAGSGIVIVPGMDTVDVTAVDTSLMGHSYYGDSGSVLADIVEVIEDAAPPDQRKWLHPEFLGAQKYWVFQR
jgi:esterase/lipase superfamily enzyme